MMQDMTCMFLWFSDSILIVSLIVCLSLYFDHKMTETEERVSVGLERTCSELRQGQLWFDPLRKGLYLCDGTVWITVLEGKNPLMRSFYPA